MTARLISIASAFPDHQADVAMATRHAQMCSCESDEQATKVAKLYRRTGVRSRGSVLIEAVVDGLAVQSFYPSLQSEEPLGPTMKERNERFAQEAPRLACQAASRALENGGVDPSQITHVVTVTCTGFTAPGLDIALIQELGLPATTQRVAVGFMGCHGLINGLRAARGLVAAEPQARVLVASVELCSLHYQYGYDTQRIVSGSLFADGAAGLVITGDDSAAETDPIGGVTATGSCLIPDSTEAMTWRIGDHGFLMTLEASVPGYIERHLKSYLVDWLAQYGHTISSIGGWAVHPGGIRILQAVETALDLPEDALDISRDVLRDHGNMSSATLGAVLGRFLQHEVPKPWLMLGFGPGLEIEVALIEATDA